MRVRNHSQLIRWGQYCFISNSHKGSTKSKFQTNVSHKFGIKSFHSHTYKSTKWIQQWIKTSLIVSGPFLSLVTLPIPSKGLSESSIQTVQSISCVWLFVIPWIAARQASLSITKSWSLLKLMCIELVMPSSHLILCHPIFLLLPIPLSITVRVPLTILSHQNNSDKSSSLGQITNWLLPFKLILSSHFKCLAKKIHKIKKPYLLHRNGGCVWYSLFAPQAPCWSFSLMLWIFGGWEDQTLSL